MGKVLFRIGIIIFFVTTIQCKKKQEAPTADPKEQTNPATNQNDITIWENVKVIDTTFLKLNFLKSNLDLGEYVFDKLQPITVQPNDVIVGAENEGYIRRVLTVKDYANQITLTTAPGNMEDVFKSGSFKFTSDMSNMQSLHRVEGLNYSVSNKSLKTSTSLSLDLVSGNLTFDPKWNFDWRFSERGLESFVMSAEGSTYSASANIKATAKAKTEIFNKTDTILSSFKKVVFRVPVPVPIIGVINVPVVVLLNFTWAVDYSGSVSSDLNSDISIESKGPLSVAINYHEKQWNNSLNFRPTTTFNAEMPNGPVAASLQYGHRPIFSAKFYGLEGPYLSVALNSQTKGTVSIPDVNWDFKVEGWVKTEIGGDGKILTKQFSELKSSWETERISYNIPYLMRKISGDNQIGELDKPLTKPVKVQVLDSQKKPAKNVKVYFTVKSGNGSVESAIVHTDDEGYAETTWKLGNSIIELTQYLEVRAKSGDNKDLQTSPIEFAATGGEVLKDIDGNIYKIIKIGNQVWMAENLKTSRLNDSTIIPLDLYSNNLDTTVDNTFTPKMYYPFGNEAGVQATGALYNWFTVNTNKLCPIGWHVPSREEFTVLENMNPLDLMTIDNWVGNVSPTNNKSGFSAIPSTYHWWLKGSYVSQNHDARWWGRELSNEYAYNGKAKHTTATIFYLSTGNELSPESPTSGIFNGNTSYGLSIRCIKD